MCNLHLKYLFYSWQIISALFFLFCRDFSALHLSIEATLISSVFVIFSDSKNYISGVLYAFFQLIVIGLVLIGSSGYNNIDEVAPSIINKYLVIISLFMCTGVFPFSFLISYCTKVVYDIKFFYIHFFVAKTVFISFTTIFMNMDKFLFIFFGLATIIHAIVLFSKRLKIRILSISSYLVPILIFFFMRENVIFDSVIFDNFVFIFPIIFVINSIIIIYNSVYNSQTFLHIALMCTGTVVLSITFNNVVPIFMLCVIEFFIFIFLLLYKKKEDVLFLDVKEDNFLFHKNSEYIIGCIKEKSLNNRFANRVKIFIKLIFSTCYTIRKFLNYNNFCCLQIDSIACNIFVLLSIFVVSSIWILFYVF